MVQNEDKTVIGRVIEALPNATFRVQISDGSEILGYLSGKMRKYRIKVLIGDKVKIEQDLYGGEKGRIVKRL